MALDATQERDRTLGKSDNANMRYLHHEALFEKTGRVLNLSSSATQQALLKFSVKAQIEVLVLDNLSCLFSGIRENESDSWELVLGWLLALRRHRIAVVIVHHAGRNGEMRGTSRREDAANWIIRLTDPKNIAEAKQGARFVSTFEKNRNSTDRETPPFEWNFSKDAAGQTVVTWKLLDACATFRQLIEEEVTNCGDIAKEMHISNGQVSKLAKRGIAQGWLKKNGRDYALVSCHDHSA